MNSLTIVGGRETESLDELLSHSRLPITAERVGRSFGVVFAFPQYLAKTLALSNNPNAFRIICQVRRDHCRRPINVDSWIYSSLRGVIEAEDMSFASILYEEFSEYQKLIRNFLHEHSMAKYWTKWYSRPYDPEGLVLSPTVKSVVKGFLYFHELK